MRQIIFMSSLVSHDLTQLQTIVKGSFEDNFHSDIRGMILYCDGCFVQVLEGKKDAINDAFSKILVDIRHVGIHVLLEEKVDRREFETWSFGFNHLNKLEVEKWELKGDWFKVTD